MAGRSKRTAQAAQDAQTLGNKLAPPRFVLFFLLMIVVSGGALTFFQRGFMDALVIGFDLAAAAFTLSLFPLVGDRSADSMRRHAAENDANRGVVLGLTAFTSLAVLAAISGELPAAKAGHALAIAKLVGTLVLSWVFTNLIFALHYAHLHYLVSDDGGGDHGGFDFPGTPEPDYWDFLYFSFTAGMSFAASDVNVTNGRVRRVVVGQSLLSFVFNIGVLAFSINVLAGAAG